MAQHIVNAQLDDDMSDIVNVTRIMQDILNIIKYSYNRDFNEESVYYYRFVTHLKFFAQRILNRLTYEDDDEDVFPSF